MVGVPDRYVGEDVVAFVVLRNGMRCDDVELLAFCESRLGPFKTPSRIHFVDDLPKGPSGKVQRLRLLEEAENWPPPSLLRRRPIALVLQATPCRRRRASRAPSSRRGANSSTCPTSIPRPTSSRWGATRSAPSNAWPGCGISCQSDYR